MNPNHCVSPIGNKGYHLGHILGYSLNNQGFFINGERLDHKPNEQEKYRAIQLKRAGMLLVERKLSAHCIADTGVMSQLVFNAVMTKTVGIAFGLRVLDEWLKSLTFSTENEKRQMQDVRQRIANSGRRRLLIRQRQMGNA